MATVSREGVAGAGKVPGPRCHAAVQESDEPTRQLQEAPASASASAVPTDLNSVAD